MCCRQQSRQYFYSWQINKTATLSATAFTAWVMRCGGGGTTEGLHSRTQSCQRSQPVLENNVSERTVEDCLLLRTWWLSELKRVITELEPLSMLVLETLVYYSIYKIHNYNIRSALILCYGYSKTLFVNFKTVTKKTLQLTSHKTKCMQFFLQRLV